MIQSRGLLKQVCQALDDARAQTGQDQHLLQAYTARRDPAAFADLVRKHGPLVLGVCRRVLHDTHDAEDAFQATFLVLVRKAGSIRKREAVASWLYGVAYRLASKLKLQAARRRQREREVAPPTTARAGDLTWDELRGLLDEELARLPERWRAPLLLCYLAGKTQDEAAQQLGWSFGTFRRRLERGRDVLRERLARRGLALSAALFPALLTQQAEAALPAALLAATCQAAEAFASGPVAVGAVASSSVQLAEEFMRTLLLTKLKVVSILAAMLALCGAALGVWRSGLTGLTGVVEPAVFGAVEQQPAAAQPPAPGDAVAKRLAFPRRLLAVSVHNYAYFNPVSAGAGEQSGAQLIQRLAERLSIPAEQLVLLSDRAPPAEPRPQLPPLSAAELARLPDEEVQRLLDGRRVSPPMPPTRAVIEHNVRRFLESCRSQDRIVLLFVGHAVEIDDQAYLAPLEGERDRAESLIPVQWFYDRLAECKARQKVFVVDVCRFDPARGEERGAAPAMGKRLDDLLARPPAGVQVLSGCTAGQHSYELDNKAQAGVQGGIVLNLLPQLKLEEAQRPQDSLPVAALVKALAPRTRYLAQAFLQEEQTPRLSGVEAESREPYDPKTPPPPRFKLELAGAFQKGMATRAEIESLFTEIAGLPALRTGSAAVAFEKQVLPIFQAKCAQCHLGDNNHKGKVDLRTVATIKKGGSEGPAVVPHDPKKSRLWQALEQAEMPPKGFPALTAAEKVVIRQWIATGAKDSKEAALASNVPGPDFDALPPFPVARLAVYAADGKDSLLREKVREAIALLKSNEINQYFQDVFIKNFQNGNQQQEHAFKDQLYNIQTGTGLIVFKLDSMLEELNGLKTDRARETKRWQAYYDYIRARLAARIAHVYEYNAKLGEMRKEFPEMDPNIHRGWQLAAKEKISDRDAAMNDKRAKEYLTTLAAEHAGTPWELLAQRELQLALGLEWRPR
ncbi:MAG: sigma-70 family RNA polymerase sigma factor, partial [Planctomycetia bacterium]|nr:sigma-70 family RNA polymerase sigma factor [Planctomycetia bacterium]